MTEHDDITHAHPVPEARAAGRARPRSTSRRPTATPRWRPPPRSRRSSTRPSASSSARTRCSSACSSRCSPTATCCSRAFPGLAKTLTVKTLARVLGGTFSRVQFTPDLVPADLVGTRVWRPDTRHVRHRARPGLRQPAARRRDQPRAREGAVGAARGHAGAAGDDRRRDVPGAVPVPRARDAEPDRVRGHLPAARGPARPLPAEDPRRLPEPRGRVGGRLARHRRRARGAAGARDGRAAPAPRDRSRGRRRAPRHRLRRRARRRHAEPGASTASPTWRAGSRSARAPAARSAWSRPPRRSRCCAAAAT